MALYLSKAKYSNLAFQGMLANPSDRDQAGRALFKAAGLEVHHLYFEISTGSIVVIAEGNSDQVAAIEMVIGASGAFDTFEHSELISMTSMHAAQISAQGISKAYSSPNK